MKNTSLLGPILSVVGGLISMIAGIVCLVLLLCDQAKACERVEGVRMWSDGTGRTTALEGMRACKDGLYGAFGYLRHTEHDYGMRMSLGTRLYEQQDFSVNTSWAYTVAQTPNVRYWQAWTTFHEAEAQVLYKYVGASVGLTGPRGREFYDSKAPVRLYLQLNW